jgi:predicted DNA repair protein MutK
MKTLSIVGTVAMFLVGGGIISHTIPLLHHFTEETVDHLELFQVLVHYWCINTNIINFVIGFIAGAIVLIVVNL